MEGMKIRRGEDCWCVGVYVCMFIKIKIKMFVRHMVIDRVVIAADARICAWSAR